jgi:glucose/mannose-6-phosphate isomerase
VLAAASFISEPDLAEASAAVSKALEGEETRAREMAERIFGRVPIIWGGSPLTGAVAQRWKTQMNENAKSPAWWSMLPEADHNEIVGWSGALSRHFVVVPLVDGDDHPRIARRLAATRRLTDPRLEWLEPVSAGEGAPLSRMLRLAAVADLVTLELARRYRVDPGSVAVIDELKQLLEES